MACQSHECLECDHQWSDNNDPDACPKCNCGRIETYWDEAGYDHKGEDNGEGYSRHTDGD